jgi:hypothetical protein
MYYRVIKIVVISSGLMSITVYDLKRKTLNFDKGLGMWIGFIGLRIVTGGGLL